MRSLFVVLNLLLLSCDVWSQVLPAEGSRLNYRIVGFSIGEEKSGSWLEIASGNHNTLDSFSDHVVFQQRMTASKTIAEVPAFGSAYTWRVVVRGDKTSEQKAVLHHFSTDVLPDADTAKMRVRVIQKARKYKDSYVFLDGNRALYNMDGEPVWFLPAKENFRNEKMELRDLKLTPQGTITFLLIDKPYEINYNGDILWTAPNKAVVSGDSLENFHHEFTRIANGHYMILGNQNTFWKSPTGSDGDLVQVPKEKVIRDSFRFYRRLQLGTIIEYDEKGNVVWNWKTSTYMQGSDVFFHRRANGTPDPSMHDNSFYFDQKHGAIYLGLRNISRIVKIKYPEGNVLNSYGEKFEPGAQEKGNGLFCRQHSCRLSKEGNLYLYNNNMCKPGTVPTVVMMREAGTKNGQLEKVWEYQCTVEGITAAVQYDYNFTTGGSVTELPGGEILVCMGGSYSKVMIVSKDKKVLWSVLPEKWDTQEQKLKPLYSYRASIVNTPGELELLVWGNK